MEKIRLSSQVSAYLNDLEGQRYAPATLRLRRLELGRLGAWCAGRGVLNLHEITRSALAQYRLEMASRVGQSSQHSYLVCVRHFFAFCLAEGLIVENPAAYLVSKSRPVVPHTAFASDEGIERLLASVDSSSLLGMRDRAMLELLYASGLRRAELLALRTFDVCFDDSVVKVRCGKGGKARVVPVSERALGFVRRWLSARRLVRGRCDALFLSSRGSVLSARQLSKLCSRYALAVGLEGSCHMLRHSVATSLHRQGSSLLHVGQFLGHADLRATVRYTRVVSSDVAAMHRRCLVVK